MTTILVCPRRFFRPAAAQINLDHPWVALHLLHRPLTEQLPHVELPDISLRERTAELIGLGFKNFDAFHVACAELGGAEVFGTCDDGLLAAARRHTVPALPRPRIWLAVYRLPIFRAKAAPTDACCR